MAVVITIIKVIVVLGFLVFIHEGGHFLVAKKCGIKVNEFAIGFGPRILSWKGKETIYAIRLIPLGGFVNMEGEEERSEDERSFNKKSPLKRIAVVSARTNCKYSICNNCIFWFNNGDWRVSNDSN